MPRRPHSRCVLALLSLLAMLGLGCVAGGGLGAARFANAPGQSTMNKGIYANETYQLRMRFESLDGWSFSHGADVAANCPPPHAIFCASNQSRLLNVVLMLEDGGIPMSNADYHTLVRRGLREDGKLEHESIDQVKLAGQDSVLWTYTHTGDAIVQAFFSRGSQNYRMVIITPEDAFARRKSEILRIARSFEFVPSRKPI